MAESNADDTYVLNRDFTASTRLNCQHYMWQQEIRFNLHPSIPEAASGAAIADVAAGTGVWLIEVAKQYPLVDCLGLDISTTQSPPKAWLPSNVDFKVWDFTEKPPASLSGRFDVVHIRLIGIVFDHEPIKAIQNMASLLKPGGYLQWEEMEFDQTVIATAGDAVKADAIVRKDAMMKTHGARIWVTQNRRSTQLEWISRYDPLRHTAGYVSVEISYRYACAGMGGSLPVYPGIVRKEKNFHY